MKNTLNIEDVVNAFNINFKMIYPNSTGNFIVKKNVEKAIFGAIKTYTIEVYFVDSTNTPLTELFMTEKLTMKVSSELEENKAWSELAIITTAKLFSFIDYKYLDKYGYRS
jgi:hypothetical protein